MYCHNVCIHTHIKQYLALFRGGLESGLEVSANMPNLQVQRIQHPHSRRMSDINPYSSKTHLIIFCETFIKEH